MLPTLLAAAAAGASAAAANVFASGSYYVNGNYQQRVQASLEKVWVDDATRASLRTMQNTGSAFWIDTVARIKDASEGLTLESAFHDAASKASPPLIVAILYNLPNRDCHALASNGELCCEYASDGTCVFEASDPTCADGLRRYKHHYVDNFVAVLERYSTVPVAVVIEPDSLPNLATNMEDARCGNAATQAAYEQGIRYAIESLSQRAPRAALYLDAGHGGWLGWPDKADNFLETVARMGPITSKLRGFATNVANYQSLGNPCPASAFDEGWPQLGQQYCAQHNGDLCCRDPCALFAKFNSANSEHNYVQLLSARSKRSSLHATLPDPRFIIDTGRNGRDDHLRSDCANWCNIRGAAVGHTPTSQTLLPEKIDAYYWLKTPGESDGCTETLPNGEHCARYDGSCGSPDSIGSRPGEPRAPEAGQFFAPQLAELSCRSTQSADDASREGFSTTPPPENCPNLVAKASEEAAQEAASAPKEDEKPRYDWRQSSSSSGDSRVTGQADGGGGQGGGGPLSASTPAVFSATAVAGEGGRGGDGTSSGWSALVLCGVIFFAIWFAYPRIEPKLRQLLGDSGYDSLARSAAFWARHLLAVAKLAAIVASVVWNAVLRARGSTGASSTGGAAKRLPTADEEDAADAAGGGSEIAPAPVEADIIE